MLASQEGLYSMVLFSECSRGVGYDHKSNGRLTHPSYKAHSIWHETKLQLDTEDYIIDWVH